MRSPQRLGAVAALVSTLVLTTALVTTGDAAQSNAAGVGSPGIGDPYFPYAGNGGYNVTHYALDLTYRPSGDQLSGTTTVTARATEELTRFNLDFAIRPSAVQVNGEPAAFEVRDHEELEVTPRQPVAAGFHDTVYDRGAMTLHVLRTTVGDEAFFTTLRRWVTDRKDASGTTAELQRVDEDAVAVGKDVSSHSGCRRDSKALTGEQWAGERGKKRTTRAVVVGRLLDAGWTSSPCLPGRCAADDRLLGEWAIKGELSTLIVSPTPLV